MWGSFYYYGGMPRLSGSVSNTLTVLANTGYAVGYDESMRNPAWVCMAGCYGAQAQVETFYMSNVVPLRATLYRTLWQPLERDELDLYAQRFGQVWIMAGPIFDDPTLHRGVAIPTACYKILVAEENGHPKALAFLLPQDVPPTAQLMQYLTSVQEIEQKTGLRFFPDLPADIQHQLATETAKSGW